MTRSSAWQTFRRRAHSTRPANIPDTPLHRDGRFATGGGAEHVRLTWPSDAKLEEWKSLEFRHLKPPSDEDWNR
ncbi:MAG TPA: hypothetical protein VGG17_01590 [Acidimicrobiales bacterium]